ncbi:MAG: hypothetical protein AAB597_00885 [Patescibacteria group bacterium]
MQNLARILKLFNLQIGLASQIAFKEAFRVQMDTMHEMSLHKRDAHHGYVDTEMVLRLQKERAEELSKLQDKFKENDRELNKLLAELKVAQSI